MKYNKEVAKKLSERYAETFDDLDEFMKHLECKFEKLSENETYEFISGDELFVCKKKNDEIEISKSKL